MLSSCLFLSTDACSRESPRRSCGSLDNPGVDEDILQHDSGAPSALLQLPHYRVRTTRSFRVILHPFPLHNVSLQWPNFPASFSTLLERTCSEAATKMRENTEEELLWRPFVVVVNGSCTVAKQWLFATALWKKGGGSWRFSFFLGKKDLNKFGLICGERHYTKRYPGNLVKHNV